MPIPNEYCLDSVFPINYISIFLYEFEPLSREKSSLVIERCPHRVRAPKVGHEHKADLNKCSCMFCKSTAY